jgi:hypothetical protein
MSALEGGLMQMLGLRERGWRIWRELSLLSALFLDLSWIAPWLHAMLAAPTKASLGATGGALVLLALAAYSLLRASAILGLSGRLRRWILVLPILFGLPAGIAAILYPGESASLGTVLGRFMTALHSGVSIIPDEFLVALALVYTWMRAVHWAASDGLPSEIRGRFKFGFFALIAYVLAFVWRGGGGGLGIFLYAYFFFAWFAMACAR